MNKIKRVAPFGATILILIIILLSTTIHYKYQCVTLHTTLNGLQKEYDALTEEQIKLTITISELEKQLEDKSVCSSHTESKISSRSLTKARPNISMSDRETLARLVFLEANTENLECQKAIASVIINRLNSGYWGNTINNVVYAQGQFTPASRIPYVKPTNINYEAVDYVLTNGSTLPSYVLYFRAGYHFEWSGYTPYLTIGNTYFGYMEKDMNQ